jgi:hypothetical protein
MEEIMNDYYVNTGCSTRVHIGGYVFTINELFNIACDFLSEAELAKHEEK